MKIKCVDGVTRKLVVDHINATARCADCGMNFRYARIFSADLRPVFRKHTCAKGLMRHFNEVAERELKKEFLSGLRKKKST